MIRSLIQGRSMAMTAKIPRTRILLSAPSGKWRLKRRKAAVRRRKRRRSRRSATARSEASGQVGARLRASRACALLLLRSLDAFHDQRLRFRNVAPLQHLHPFAFLEILVVLEEMLDLLQRDLGKVAVVFHLVVALGELRRGHRDDLLVAAGLVLHQEHADRA